MQTVSRVACLAVAVASLAGAAAAERKEFRFAAGSGAHVSITNDAGPVTVRASSGRQVLIVATTHSPSAQVDATQSANRIEASSQFAAPVSGDEGRVEFEVSIPADVHVTVRAARGPIQVERLRGDVTLEGAWARVEVRDVADGHVHVRTMNGAVLLSDVADGHVEVTTVSGDVQLNNVGGPSVIVTSTKGNIRVSGAFATPGSYQFTNGSGDIDLSLPGTASVALKASSARGNVENDFPPAPDVRGKNFVGGTRSGTSYAGASSVTVRSLSGRIRVKKR